MTCGRTFHLAFPPSLSLSDLTFPHTYTYSLIHFLLLIVDVDQILANIKQV